MLAHRCGDLFAFSTKEPGVVTDISAKHLSVTYASGQRVAVEMGRRFGVVAGKNIPHQIVTDAVVGQKFEKNAVLAWNSDFFQRDRFYPDQVRYKAGVLIRYGITDTVDTFEDSSAITTKTSKLMSTKLTKKKTFILRADQKISHLVREGTVVESDDVLCVIEDPITANTNLFNETTADLLKERGARTQLAGVDGVVEQIEVLYRCDLEDMSESIREIATRADRQRAKLAKQLGRGDAPAGRILDRVRVNGRPLETDTIAVTVFITYSLPMVAGDKHVAGHQLKSVPGRVIEGELLTETGVELGGFFAHMSIFNRIVLSVYKLGTTNALIDAGSREMARIYFED